MAGPLDGRTAVVTGASRGIGLACASALAGAGARVALVARSSADLAAHARELGRGAVALTCDVADAHAVQAALAELRRLLGADAPDLLVNNAGHFAVAPLESTSPETFARTLGVNLAAPFLFVHGVVPGMKARGSGHLVTIGSVADHVAFAGNAAYAASKYGLRGLHEVLRVELRGTGVRTTLVSPGPVDTDLWSPANLAARPGAPARERMLDSRAVADAVLYAVTQPPDVNVDELRLSYR
ncbi:MAG: SDR family oxidoreductase [Gemmatimonadota bacterium]|nr:SDR family oxidoreductase [Gemmatimonadota bacterium]MDE3172400.1 SDR family oxidoreductase [Gemmatimonadota bacterium]MDE3216168.1 SDR family oxidoreductase [Gemmatimonadota bacterium]